MKILPINKQEDNEEKLNRRADILFPSMKEKKNGKTSKKSLLGESIFDDEIDEDKNQIKKETKNISDNNTKQDVTKPRKERTLAETSDILDLMYPTMKNGKKQDKSGKNADNEKVDKFNLKEKTNNKQGTFTGGASNVNSKDIDNTVFSEKARKKARKFIQNAEEFKANAYQDEKGIWTIGYGHTKGVKPGDKITEDEAEKLYAEDFKIHSEPLKYVKVPLNDNEKVALSSLIYNIGEPQFKNSTVLKKLNEGDKKAAAEAFKLFCKESKVRQIDGKSVKKLEFSKGLYNRRIKEMELFLSPDE